MVIFLEGSLLKKNQIRLFELPDPEYILKKLFDQKRGGGGLLDPPPGIPSDNKLLAYNLSLCNCHWGSKKSQYIKNCVALTN